ncbi:MAG: hypothetical protein V4714_04815 [Bacteroidota bacterium]
MKKYIIYGKVKNTIYSIVNRGLEEAKQKAEALKKIITGEEFYIIEAFSNKQILNWDSANVDEFLKGAIRVQ